MPGKLGCVLSGGGVPGIAGHLGFLSGLEEQGITPDVVVGASAGGAVAGLLASGISVEEQVDFFRRQRPYDLLFGETTYWLGELLRGHNSPPGILSTYPLWIKIVSEKKRVSEWPPSYGVVASDLTSLGPAYITSTSIFNGMYALNALQATTAFPVLLKGVMYAGRLLVDGGMYDNIPINFARRLGASYSLVVKITHHVPIDENGMSMDWFVHKILRAWMEFAEKSLNFDDAYPTYVVEVQVRGSLLSFDYFYEDFKAGQEAAKAPGVRLWIEKMRERESDG